jgi:phosphoribosylamine--glycine ligase
MKILLVGSGGREHALAWKIAQSPKVEKIYCAPGNAGIASAAECIDIQATDIPALLAFAKEKKIDLAVIGPESPLIMGIVDEFLAAGIPAFGPSGKAAAIEGSKVFSKELMARHKIPSAEFRSFEDPDAANAYIESISHGDDCPIVVKADGEALGKGVFVCAKKSEALDAVKAIMVEKVFGKAGDRLIVEELLIGQEASLMAITDGKTVLPMLPVQDHKRALDGDLGPNTGGMGCYSPVPVVTPELYSEVLESIIKPTVQAMSSEGRPYTGVLYTGVILTDKGPKVLEYNARFGDPETQVVLPLMKSDIVDLMLAAVSGSLDSYEISWYNEAAVCVVIASGGYPGAYEKGKPISGLDAANALDGVTVFHAGTKLVNGNAATSGGRVLGVTGVGKDIKSAIATAYSGVDKIEFEGMHYRKDIGAKALK